MVRKTPYGASIAEDAGGARLFAPAAERNRSVLAALVRKIAPETGTALEIASGTGQHVVAFAETCPTLQWQPTDVLPDRLTSIDAHAHETGCGNIAPAKVLNATEPGWGQEYRGSSFVFLANLLHLISTQETITLMDEAASAVTTGGAFVVYGPFKRDGRLTSAGDQSFHDSLKAQDPEIGYKDTQEVIAWAQAAGLAHAATHEMPANNLSLEFRKPV